MRGIFHKLTACAMAACLIGAMAGCNGNGAKTPEGKTKVTLSYWNTEETMAPLLELLEEKLEDVTVEYNYVENQFYGTAVKTKLTAGQGDDIIAFASLDVLSLSAQGQIVDLTNTYGSLYTDAGKAPYTFDGKLYAVPMLSWFEGVFYNKTLFAENNIQVPTTFDELLQVCARLKEAGIKPIAMGAKDGSTLLKSLLGYVTAEYLLTDTGKDFDANFAKGETSMSGNWDPYVEKWKALIDNQYINTDMLGIDDSQAMDEFSTGKAAMWASGPWSYSSIKQKNIKLDFDMFPYLGNTSDKTCLIGSPGAGFVLNSNSKVMDAAKRVLDVISSPEGQAALMEGNPGSSSYLIGVKSELPKEYASIQSTLEAGKVYCSWENWGLGTNCFNNYTQDLQGLVAGRISVADMLKDVDTVAMSYVRGETQ